MKQCSISGCDRSEKARTWCDLHYQRWQHHSDPLFTTREFHGMNQLPEYKLWLRMKGRCNNPNNGHYPYYGGRGIKVSDRWSKFSVFFADMGLRPSPKHSLDRIDVNGGYEPSNCRWATAKEQANNRRPRTTHEQLAKAYKRIEELEGLLGLKRTVAEQAKNL